MASRSLSETESRYSNIERECLAVMFGLEKFEYYLLGRHTLIETDHSPLEQIFKKNISDAPARLQRLLLRCMKFDVEVVYRRGDSIPVADALSRVCPTKAELNTEPGRSASCAPDYDIHFLTHKSCPINIEAVKLATAQDSSMSLLKEAIYNGWPSYRKQCPIEIREYWNFRCDLVLEDGAILKGDRVVIPDSMRKQVLDTLHMGHQGETKCLLMARQSVFWPGITEEIRQSVKNCTVCNKYLPAPPKLPAMQPDLPTRPWEKLGTDIFEFSGSKYLMIVDYFSRFPVIRRLGNMTASTISDHFTSVFAEYGLPSVIQADFGSQYISEEFKARCNESGITFLFSSPYHHQTNSLAEKTVGICKTLWKKAIENKHCPYTAIWMHRVTPLGDQLPSPHELLFGRKPKLLLPSSKGTLQSSHPHNDEHQEANKRRQERQSMFYNRKAGPDKKALNAINRIWQPGKVLSHPNPQREPRTYIVEIKNKLYQRTREHLRPHCVSKEEAPPVRHESSTPIGDPAPFHVTPAQPPVHQEVPRLPDPVTQITSSPTDLSRTDEAHACSNGTEVQEAVGEKKVEKASFQPRSQTTRSGRVTKVPSRFDT